MSENLICSCFGYTAEDIRRDVAAHGRSTTLARILTEKKNGACRCGSTNPKGR